MRDVLQRIKLPAEAAAWIESLSADERDSLEYVLNLVGAESFLANWKEHRDATEYMRNF